MEKDAAAEFDLSSDRAWHGLRPGMTRGEVMALVAKAGVPYDDADRDPGWLRLEGDWGMELRFEKSGAEALRQISRDDYDLTWRGEPLLGAPLHEALAVMQADAGETAWHPEDAVNDPMDGSPPLKPGPYSDEALLYEGTVWLPKRGLGLTMLEGSVCELVWRRAEDLPTKLEGPVTAAQLALSRQPDLAQTLRNRLKTQPDSFVTSKTWNPVQWVLFLLFVFAMGTVLKRGLEEAQQWQQALVLTGHLTASEPVPGNSGKITYHIEYRDPRGHKQTIALEQADFYVAPREIGDEAQINYIPGEPPRVMGLPRARDAAFIHYVPQGAGLVVGYMVTHMLAGWLGQRRKAASALGKSNSPPDPNQGSAPPGLPKVERF